MENGLTYYTDLINKYFSGECSPEEARILMTWILAEKENNKLFEEYRKTWNIIEKDRVGKQIDAEHEWLVMDAMLMERKKVRKSESQKMRRSAGKEADLTVKHQLSGIQHTISYRHIRTSITLLLRVAAFLLLIAIPSYFLVRYFSQPGIKQVIAQNKVFETSLPDGTVVTLNKGSSLEYPSRFKGKTRNVKLHGEGFFKVKHDNKHSFIISSGNIRIEVMGTIFYVNTLPEEGFAGVILTSGAVAIYYADNPSGKVILKPGEKARILIDGKEIDKEQNEDPNYLAWKTGTLIFNGDPLSKIISVINKVYHSDIRIQGNNISGCQVTVTFTEQSLGSVLNVLKATLDLQIKYTGAKIELSGNGCK